MQNKTHPSCNFAGLEEKKFSSLFLRRCCIVPCEVNSRQAPFQLNLTPGNVLFLPICFPPSWPLYRTALCELRAEQPSRCSPARASCSSLPASCLPFLPVHKLQLLESSFIHPPAQSQACSQPSLPPCFLPSAGDVSESPGQVLP